MLKAGFISLGCAKNLVDTEVMLGVLNKRGIEITADPQEADIIIINTCSFINSAKEESITTILQMADFKDTAKCRGIVVAGCLGQRYGKELLDELPEVDAIIGTSAWQRIGEAIDAVLRGERVLFIDENNAIYDDKTPRISTTPFYSAYIKIAEGCSNCCSYCVIPLVRGKFRSRTIESIVAETERLVAGGVREINLIAQDTTSYGRDRYGRPALTELLRKLVKIDGVLWIRLLYCYPKYFTDELIQLIAEEPKICNYVDLPLQHADDEILKAMHRQDSSDDVKKLLSRLRRKIPGVVIRTSFIVGFPGETERHYRSLRSFVESRKFERVGVFTYSQEEGTIAAALPEQVSDEVKEERFHDLMSLQCQISEQLNRDVEGKVLEVLVEGLDSKQPGVAYGRSYREAPDVDGCIYIENAAGVKPGDLIKVKVIQGYTYDLLSERLI